MHNVQFTCGACVFDVDNIFFPLVLTYPEEEEGDSS